MENITLAEAVPLPGQLEKKIAELIRERDAAAVALVAKGETAEMPTRTVEIITAELEKVRADYEVLNEVIAKANLKVTIEWDGEEITLNRAITKAKNLQKKVQEFKVLGGRKKSQRRPSRFGESIDLIEVATYVPEQYRTDAEKLERQARRLSSTIEHRNHEVYVDFDASAYLG